MQNKLKEFINKYISNTATVQEEKIVDDFVDYLQKRPLIDLQEVKGNSILRNSIYTKIKYQTYKRNKQKKYRLATFGILLVITIGVIFHSTTSINSKAIDVYTTANEVKQIVLQDGTKVELSAYSSLNISTNFNQLNRKVQLKGSAFFHVVKNVEKPFIISSDNFETQVLGTSFWVKKQSVEVATGRVKVSRSQDKENFVILYPTDKVWLKNHRLYKNTLTILSCVSSNSSNLMMKDFSFKQWKQVIESEFGIQILFHEKLIHTTHLIHGDFRNSTLKDIVQSIVFMYDLDYKYENNTLIINNTKK
ncbi:MAG: FecR family protein [Flavobacteriaceae bacterium]|jgi:hypothetical protein|nr:FecR family protein [Flavobacteriaceae bacterium]